MRRSFTLIEMLVSLTITMIMMLAVVTLFQVMTDSVSGSRALMETSDRLRACRNRLQADLQGATATMTPPLRPESDEGYFEIGEGQYTDSNNVQSAIAPLPAGATLYGDTDDYLAFTTRSRGEPFIGKYGAATTESQAAEVIYFLSQTGAEPIMDATQAPPTRLYTLYRRVLLVSPSLTGLAVTDDVSQRVGPSGQLGNSLGDLTKRENRFNHSTAAFPFLMTLPIAPLPGGRLGDDVILNNVIAFDVQIYDPGAPIYVSGSVALEPRDLGYAAQFGVGAPTAFGAYADLAYGRAGSYTPPGGAPLPIFNSTPAAKSGWTAGNPFTFDTWSLHYENNGVDENGDGVVDGGTNGLDDDGVNGVDDLGEYDTLPPYSVQLRGVRIIVRVYEPSSQQVREITVMQDFLPE